MTGKVIDLLTEFDEMGYIPTTFTENAEQAAIDWKNRLVAAIEAENAALRNQISEMVMPPCTLGETLYIVACTFGDEYVDDEIVHQSGFSVVKSVVTEKNFYKMCDLVRNGKAFFSREAAEKELEELTGKCKCKFDRI